MELTNRILGNIGRRAIFFIDQLTGVNRLIKQVLYWMLVAPFKRKGINWRETVEQMVKIGVESLPIVSLIAFFVGLIIAMQSAYQLKQFGATIYVANLVAVSVIRELSPLLTAIVVTGRSGSAITAEIGTRKLMPFKLWE
jgi:phospholipid/cholesterol/gamma-HCH transport system permease protein